MQSEFQAYLAGYQSEIVALDEFIEECLKNGKAQELTRLNTYLRRYFSPLVIGELFRRKCLPLLLSQQELDSITALVLDIRGFVKTAQSGERTVEGLDVVARLLRMLFSRIICAAFENYGLVGEFAGDRILVTFGFPPLSSKNQFNAATIDELEVAVRRAINTAFAILRVSEDVKADESFPSSVRQFEVGIGICAGRRAWIGDIGGNYHHQDSEETWRQELTFISTAVNIAARAEELTKMSEVIAAAPDRKIIVDKGVIDKIRKDIVDFSHIFKDLGEIDVRGLDEKVELFHLFGRDPSLHTTAERITEADKMLVNWICKHIDGAIERDIAVKVNRSLSDVGQAIASSPIPSEETVFGQIMAQIIHSFEAEKATLYRIDPMTKELVVVSSTGPSPLPSGTRLSPNTGIAGLVVATGEALISSNVHTNPSWRGMKHDPAIHSMMCVPLKASGTRIGVIQVMDDQIGAFTETDLTSLKAFAELAAIALENARTYERATHISRARSIITEAFSSSQTLEQVLDSVMEAVREIWSAHNATLYLVNQETGEIVFKKVISESANPPKPGTALPVGTGIVGWVIANKADRLILDTHTDLDWYNKIGSDMRSMICVPLITKGHVLGAIQILDRTPNRFDREDLETLKWLSASAAVTVHNVDQIEQARRKLIASESMAGLGAIAGKLAHNLKNQVAGIKTIAKYQLKSSDPKDAEKIERIIRAADQALIEVKSFMQPLTEWEPTSIDVNEVLQDMIRRIRMSFEARQESGHLRVSIEIEDHLSNRPLFVSAGKAQLEYIFHNIIDNAIRAIDERGKPSGMIVVKTFTERIHEAEWVVVTIEDSGIGIHQENIDRIFEPMFTTRPEGTVGGYGLFWVRLNVERLGGRVTASNRSADGAIFLVRLPSITTDG